MITVIGALRPQHSEAVVRTAFQALQLVLTDFLPLIPHHCLPLGRTEGALLCSLYSLSSKRMNAGIVVCGASVPSTQLCSLRRQKLNKRYNLTKWGELEMMAVIVQRF